MTTDLIMYVVCGTIDRRPPTWREDLGALYVVDMDAQPTLNHADAWQVAYDYAVAYNLQWCCILEDDTIIDPRTFRQTMSTITENLPRGIRIWSPYLGTGRPAGKQGAIRDAVAKNPAWIIHHGLLSHVAVVAHIDLVPTIIDHLHAKPGVACDTVLDVMTRRIGEKVAYCYPSPVDHADGETTVPHTIRLSPHEQRKAWLYDPVWSPGESVELYPK